MGVQEALLATIATMDQQKLPYKQRVKLFRRQCIYSAVNRHRGNVKKAAAEMGLTANAIYFEFREAAKEKIAETGTL